MLFAANFDRNMTTEVPTRCSLMKSDNQHSLKAFPSPSNIRWGGQTQRTANEKHQNDHPPIEIEEAIRTFKPLAQMRCLLAFT